MRFRNSGKIIYDVSFWQSILRDQYGNLLPVEQQRHIDFHKMKNQGNASAVIIRAGQDYYRDVEFQRNWESALAAGIPRASYWFCDKDSSPQGQAKFYWDLLKNDAGEGFISGDIEVGSWTDWDSWYIFFNELQQRSGYPDHKIFIYTGYYFWQEWSSKFPSMPIASRKWFAKFPLWLAAYAEIRYSSLVKVPPYWNDVPTLWQWGTPAIGLKAGVWSKEIDSNLWNDESPYTFEKVFGKAPVVIPPVENVMMPYEIRIGNHLYRKSG